MKIGNIEKTFIGIIFVGIVLRLIFYSYDRPFWNDECALALNLVDFNFLNCFKSLNYGQAAPPLFLIISETFTKFIPDIELSLRFFPLISSILSLFVFYDLSRRILNKKSTILFAFILFCFNYRLIYYAQEFKQYSSDVLIFISILASYFYLNIKNISTKRLTCFSIAYAINIWLSFTSLFSIFTVLSVLLLKQFKEYKKTIALALPTLISLGFFYISQHHLATSSFLHNYWAEGFISPNFSNILPLIFNYFSFSFNNLFLFLLFLIGIVLKLKEIKNEKSLILILPLILAMALSYFSVYPLSARVALYLIPIFILLSVQILDYINIKNKLLKYFLYSVIIFLGSFTVILNSMIIISLRKFEYEDIIFALNSAKQTMRANDILYIPDGSKISYEFYKKNFHFKNVMLEEKRITDSKDYENFLNTLPKGRTYYYIFCHFPNKQERLNNIYLWAKEKKDFKIEVDKSLNAMVVFTQ